jgi:cell division protein FtsB
MHRHRVDSHRTCGFTESMERVAANLTQRWMAKVRDGVAGVPMGRRRAATLAAAALALGVAFHVIFGANGLTAYQHKRQEAQQLSQQMQDLQQQNDRLQGHVERLQNDPDAIEHQAREELHYTRPGEVIYALPAK